jgi:hypothetical protein
LAAVLVIVIAVAAPDALVVMLATSFAFARYNVPAPPEHNPVVQVFARPWVIAIGRIF